MKKTVIFSFAFVYVKTEIETDTEQCIISMSDDDLIIYIFDNDVTEQQFHQIQNKFYQQYCDFNFHVMNDTEDKQYDMIDTLIHQFNNIDEFEHNVYEMM